MDCPFCDDGLCRNSCPNLVDDVPEDVCDYDGDCPVCKGEGFIGTDLLVRVVAEMSDHDRAELFEKLQAFWNMRTGVPKILPLRSFR